MNLISVRKLTFVSSELETMIISTSNRTKSPKTSLWDLFIITASLWGSSAIPCCLGWRNSTEQLISYLNVILFRFHFFCLLVQTTAQCVAPKMLHLRTNNKVLYVIQRSRGGLRRVCDKLLVWNILRPTEILHRKKKGITSMIIHTQQVLTSMNITRQII